MTSQENNAAFEAAWKALILRTWEDEAFKQRLLDAPMETIQNETDLDFELPDSVQMLFDEEDNRKYLHLTLPSPKSYADAELNDMELEAVAGGEGGVWAKVEKAWNVLKEGLKIIGNGGITIMNTDE